MQSRGRGPSAARVQTLGNKSAAVSKSPKWETKKISFRNNSGKAIVADLLRGQGQKGIVILCHGFASHRNSFHFPALADALASKQMGSLRLDFSGNGESEGVFEFGNYQIEAEDIRAAVLHLRSNLGLEVTGLVGHSKGASSVLLYASTYDDIPMIVNIAGRFDMNRGVTERFGADIFERLSREKQIPMTISRDDRTDIHWNLTKWSMQDRLNLNMKQVASKIQAEVLTVHGTEDQVIPVADARSYAACLKNHRLELIEGADHNFRKQEHAALMIQAVVDHCCH